MGPQECACSLHIKVPKQASVADKAKPQAGFHKYVCRPTVSTLWIIIAAAVFALALWGRESPWGEGGKSGASRKGRREGCRTQEGREHIIQQSRSTLYNSRQDILAMLQEIIPDPTPEEIEEVPVNDPNCWLWLEGIGVCSVLLCLFEEVHIRQHFDHFACVQSLMSLEVLYCWLKFRPNGGLVQSWQAKRKQEVLQIMQDSVSPDPESCKVAFVWILKGSWPVHVLIFQQIMLSWEIGALNDLKIAESSLLSLQKTSIIRKHRKPNLVFLYVAKHWQARSAEVSALASNALQQVDRAHQSGMVPSSDGPAQTFATGVGMFTV